MDVVRSAGGIVGGRGGGRVGGLDAERPQLGW